MPRVLAIHSGKRNEPGACELYRVTMPFSYLKKHWEIADWMSFSEFHAGYEYRSRINENLGHQYLDAIINAYDIIVFARVTIRHSEDAYESAKILINKIRAAGKRSVYEIDDDYTNIHRYVASGDGITLASWCDAVTVTTPHLAKTMQKMTNRPVYVLPNMLDPTFWNTVKKVSLNPDKLRIVLSGSKTHNEDWKVLAEPLKHIAEDYEHVRILVGGCHPEYLEDVKNIEFVPPLEYQKYVELIKNADIILAPVVPDDEFNLHKSPIKALEGMGALHIVDGTSCGAAVIATDNEVYRLAITNDVNGLLVEHTPEAWEKAIRDLIENTEKRHKLQKEAYRNVWIRFNLERGWEKWGLAYSKILRAPINSKEMVYADKFPNTIRPPDLPDDYQGQPRSSPYPIFQKSVSSDLVAIPEHA